LCKRMKVRQLKKLTVAKGEVVGPLLVATG
jgi:hypothetical protein